MNVVDGVPRAVLAEDEPLLADELAEQLGALWPELQIVERAADGPAALRAIDHHAPDIALLDIHLPRLSGLDVARHVAQRCHVVFITGYEQYAIDAFTAGVVDYILKPVDPGRLMASVQRLKARLRQPADSPHPPPALRAAPPCPLQWINASRGSTIRLITVDEVLYFRSDHKVTLVVTAEGEAVIRKTIRELTQELDPAVFWQVHRSAVVNVHAIDCVHRDGHGQLSLRLRNRAEVLPVAEAYRARFRQM
jgi:DNA-binding LytR/AlgR family response regulator